MPLIADIDRLSEHFEGVDSRIPFVLFKLLRRYGEHKHVEIEGPALAKLLEHEDPKMRLNSEEAAVVSTELKRFFEPGDGAWVPSSTLFKSE